MSALRCAVPIDEALYRACTESSLAMTALTAAVGLTVASVSQLLAHSSANAHRLGRKLRACWTLRIKDSTILVRWETKD